jgi:hypothetical protein
MSIQFGDLTLFDVRELSKKFDLHPVSVRTLFRTGKLKGRKIGKRWYLTEEALREYFEGSSKPAGKA